MDTIMQDMATMLEPALNPLLSNIFNVLMEMKGKANDKCIIITNNEEEGEQGLVFCLMEKGELEAPTQKQGQKEYDFNLPLRVQNTLTENELRAEVIKLFRERKMLELPEKEEGKDDE